ncbi:hypothetical protein ACMU_07215 [Actibacterium mucosum KCTC 23349]|uniref:Histidine phosphotransferase ChpT C-terminal domain-containing protein n=1 Tax=Actibacterium mucosum KCTC 23349 TaxID=1454373 RepID=A0A037ZJU8_9RHOB|nr:histidine phosphotransferase family protein [Actibacterium mucosum]KAJ56720.1 hypothetical protein ACMU_07215 [Actibacterium mucosum KCTC 23349]
MKPDTRPDLAALLGSRICHDLISPLGAIGNGMELLQMSGAPQSPEMQLIADSVAHANARIRYFRIAFGAASIDQQIGRREFASVLDDSFAGSRITIIHDVQPDLPRSEAKLALMLVLCLESALPVGGKIALSQSDQDKWQLSATGPRLNVDYELWSLLTSPLSAHDLKPAEVHFGLLADAAARARRALQVELGSETVSVRF